MHPQPLQVYRKLVADWSSASAAVIIRIPWVKTFKDPDFLCTKFLQEYHPYFPTDTEPQMPPSKSHSGPTSKLA